MVRILVLRVGVSSVELQWRLILSKRIVLVKVIVVGAVEIETKWFGLNPFVPLSKIYRFVKYC